MASAHYCVGQLGITQCVRDEDIAFHAPGANGQGIGIEHEGYAKQTAEEWDDPTSRATLWHSARLVGKLCRQYEIPIVWLSPADLQAGKSGITGHGEVSQAFKGSSHWDPGPGFPREHYLHLVGVP
jgi:N-acetyl-anhydromuramyl-L-alanine amidase AmpD